MEHKVTRCGGRTSERASSEAVETGKERVNQM